MTPKVMGAELGGPRKDDPRREPSERPEAAVEIRGPGGWRAKVPAAIVAAAISFAATWVAKPQAVVALSEADRQALQQCSKNTEALAALSKEVAEVKQEGRTFRQWVEPQIGVLLVRTDSRAYTPAPLPRH
jgi:hypothetical protein